MRHAATVATFPSRLRNGMSFANRRHPMISTPRWRPSASATARTSFGRCCPSASAVTTPIRPGHETAAALNPVRRAIPFPRFTACRTSTTRSTLLTSAKSASYSAPLPSFTTMIPEMAEAESSRTSWTSAGVGLYAGITATTVARPAPCAWPEESAATGTLPSAGASNRTSGILNRGHEILARDVKGVRSAAIRAAQLIQSRNHLSNIVSDAEKAPPSGVPGS